MVIVGVLVLWLLIGVAVFFLLRMAGMRERTYSRFDAAVQSLELQAPLLGTIRDESRTTASEREDLAGARKLSRRWIWLPWVLGVAISILVWLIFRWPIQYIVAAASVLTLLLSQLESFLYNRHIAILERQLADAIDIMVGAVSAGAAVGPAIEAATIETERPLKPFLEELSGRIRLGDEPISVFRSLAERVPLESFLLFSSSLAVHYEVGGRLAPTLATVGRTIRDRIEVTRRIQSNIAQSQFSTFAIVGLIYLIALIVWRNSPEPMEEFVNSQVGSWFVAGSIVMQAVGIFWMNLISKPKF